MEQVVQRVATRLQWDKHVALYHLFKVSKVLNNFTSLDAANQLMTKACAAILFLT